MTEIHLTVALLVVSYIGLLVYAWKHWQYYACFRMEKLNTSLNMVGAGAVIVLLLSLTLVGHPKFAFSALGLFVMWVMFTITDFEAVEE